MGRDYNINSTTAMLWTLCGSYIADIQLSLIPGSAWNHGRSFPVPQSEIMLTIDYTLVGQSIPTIPPKQRFQFSLDIP